MNSLLSWWCWIICVFQFDLHFSLSSDSERLLSVIIAFSGAVETVYRAARLLLCYHQIHSLVSYFGRMRFRLSSLWRFRELPSRCHVIFPCLALLVLFTLEPAWFFIFQGKLLSSRMLWSPRASHTSGLVGQNLPYSTVAQWVTIECSVRALPDTPLCSFLIPIIRLMSVMLSGSIKVRFTYGSETRRLSISDWSKLFTRNAPL